MPVKPGAQGRRIKKALSYQNQGYFSRKIGCTHVLCVAVGHNYSLDHELLLQSLSATPVPECRRPN